MLEVKDLKELLTAISQNLDHELQELVAGPLEEVRKQIEQVLGRPDLTEEQKMEVIHTVQGALVSPFISAAVNVAVGARVPLATYLAWQGEAWELIRNQHLTDELQRALGAKEENDANPA